MMLVVARGNGGSRAVSLGKVSQTTMTSRRYLEQLVVPLREQSLIRGISGRAGGYVLTRPASEISVGDIVEATIGPINIVECVLHPEECLKADICECRQLYVQLNDGIRTALHGLSLETLAQRGLPREVCSEIQPEAHSCPNKQT